MAFMGRPPVPSALRIPSALRRALLLDFPLYFSCAAVPPMDLVQPVLALWEFRTRPAERGVEVDGSVIDNPREREFSTGRGPAGRCRRHRPGTSPGGWRDARQQMTGVQICPPCCLRRPAPQRVQHQPAEGRFPGRWSRRRGNLCPGPAQGRPWPATQPHGAAPRALRGVTPRANQGHRGDNGIPSQGESG